MEGVTVNKKKIVSMSLKLGVMLLIVLVSIYVWRAGYTSGGRVACQNSGGYLAEGFECEYLQEDNLTTIPDLITENEQNRPS